MRGAQGQWAVWAWETIPWVSPQMLADGRVRSGAVAARWRDRVYVCNGVRMCAEAHPQGCEHTGDHNTLVVQNKFMPRREKAAKLGTVEISRRDE